MYRCPSPPLMIDVADQWDPLDFYHGGWWGVDFRLLGTRTLSVLLPAFSFSFVNFLLSFLGTGLLITSYR